MLKECVSASLSLHIMRMLLKNPCSFPSLMLLNAIPRSQAFSSIIGALFGSLGEMSTDRETKMPPSKNKIRILFNGGDNMLGRAVQLSFPVQAPGEEDIRDSCAASHYLDMCLRHPSGHEGGSDPNLNEIRERNKDGSYLWGDYKNLVIDPAPDVRILNFESAITRSIHNADIPQWKGIRYHTHIDNLLSMMRGHVDESHGQPDGAKSPVVVSFGNNHAMDYGRRAFEEETLPALETARDTFQSVGVGQNWKAASKPAIVDLIEKNVEIQVFAFGASCSGVPEEWGAQDNLSGLVYIPGLYSRKAVDKAIKISKEAVKMHSERERLGSKTLRVASVHMGPNWAYRGETEAESGYRRKFAHALIDECGFDVIYGHSSHHVRGMEVYHGKLIMYGTGDLINDYEGFENPGEEKYNRLGGIYVADFDAKNGDFEELRVIPMFMNRLQLERCLPTSKLWKPNQGELKNSPTLTQDMCRFANEMSELDAGGRSAALLMKHVDSDPVIPGGPILVSTKEKS